ncbi:UTP--glucose-1-phosphate uridylyltransferase [Nereida sp. NH-UV-3]|uniref:UTP--glucose-1-phosphate uridylyltransferase n=1 Tax=Nereida TaxID=282198 RepID=UPI0036F362CC
MTRITKAVFPVAGFGTRFLPATKAMPKELLPIIDKPLIQYAAEEAVSAGIETLIFVTGRNKRAIEDHFDVNSALDAHLRSKRLDEKADQIKQILPANVDCIFVRQAEQLGLGHAILCAKKAVSNEPFAVLLADDFLVHSNESDMARLCKAFERTEKTQLLIEHIKGPNISNYGVIRPGKKSNDVLGLIEKPSIETAPSQLASVGRYILKPEIFQILQNQVHGHGGEIQLADAINTMALQGDVKSTMLKALRFDCGAVTGYIEAIRHVALEMGY